MSDALVVSALVAAVLIGVGAAAFLVMRSPAFWADAAKQLGAALLPAIWFYISKPESDDVRKARQRCERMGGKWNFHTKKCDR
jgi:hypothetical protein